jgi:hypothetical protein
MGNSLVQPLNALTGETPIGGGRSDLKSDVDRSLQKPELPVARHHAGGSVR